MKKQGNVNYFLYIAGFIFAAFLLGIAATAVVTFIFAKAKGIAYDDVTNYRSGVILVQGISTFFLFLVPSLIMQRIFKQRNISLINAHNYKKPLFYFLGFAAMFNAYVVAQQLVIPFDSIPHPAFMQPLFDLLKEGTDSSEKILTFLFSSNNKMVLIAGLIIISILPAVFEEFFFRGIIQTLSIRATGNAHIGILIASLLFSIVHLQGNNFIAIAFLGLVLGYIYFTTQNIWIGVFCHFINNGIQGVYMIYQTHGKIDEQAVEQSQFGSIWITIFALFMIGYFIKRMYEMSNALNQTEPPTS